MKYIFVQTYSKMLVDKINNEVYAQIKSLDFFPHRFPRYDNNYRVLTYKNYRIFYRIDEKTKTVIIIQLFSTYEDYNNFDF